MKNFFLLATIALFFFSCSSKKDIIYIQDFETLSDNEISYDLYRVKTDDILKINISTEIEETLLSLGISSVNTNSVNTRESLQFNGYQVDSEGFIYFQGLGKIKVIDKSLWEIRQIFYDLITTKDLLINPSIDVKLLNSHFTILGEVNVPGKYNFLENNLNILEAIGMAGDLTINGKRKDVKIIREMDGKRIVKSVDLTNSNFIVSGNFQIFSGDIIIISPNSSRIKNAGIIGNSGTLLSLLSFLLSSIILITNN